MSSYEVKANLHSVNRNKNNYVIVRYGKYTIKSSAFSLQLDDSFIFTVMLIFILINSYNKQLKQFQIGSVSKRKFC